MPLTSSSTLNAAVVLACCLAIYLLQRSRKRENLPPGPTRLPLIGNAHQLPTVRPWIGFAEMAKVYGGLMHVDVFGQSMVVVNSRKVATELMDKRSANYSDRPIIPMLDLTTMRDVFPLRPYGDGWRRQRRQVTQDFGSAHVSQYYELQEHGARDLVRRLLDDPSNIEQEVKLCTGKLIFRVTYGYNIDTLDDPMIGVPLQGMINFDKAAQPGEFLINIIPASQYLKYIPRWFPGATFHRIASQYSDLYNIAIGAPYDWCRENIHTGKALTPNVCTNIWDKSTGEPTDEEHNESKYAVGAILGAGLDTGMSAALTFFLNMILHPEVQRKAQVELDSVIGTDRLPSIQDRPNLPYIRSILAETLRFMPSIPLCIPHAIQEDDTYEEYFIPKGAWIIPNIWQMCHDPSEYPDPMKFNPDRFKGDEAFMEQTKALAFGFGRRACSGRLFAENSLFSIIVTTLATCTILPGLDDQGNEVLPTGQYATGTIVYVHSAFYLTSRSPCWCPLWGRNRVGISEHRDMAGINEGLQTNHMVKPQPLQGYSS